MNVRSLLILGITLLLGRMAFAQDDHKIEAKAKRATKRGLIVVATMISQMVGTPAFSDRTEFSVRTGSQVERHRGVINDHQEHYETAQLVNARRCALTYGLELQPHR